MSIKKMSTSTLREQRSYPSMAMVPSLDWATVDATTGSPTVGTFTDGSAEWQYYKFTTSGSMTFSSPGYVDMLVVGSGGGGEYDGEFGATGGGGGGCVRWGIQEVAADTSYTVTVGGGGAFGQLIVGNPSSFGSILKSGGGKSPRISGDQTSVTEQAHHGGGMGGAVYATDGSSSFVGGGQGGTVYGSNIYDGINLNYDGTVREYGKGGTGVAAVANTGGGGRIGNYNGADGVVIVKIRIR